MNKKSMKKNGSAVLSAEDMEKTIGSGLSFGAAEAYKLLRINLSFSLPNKTSGGQAIGVTSSLRGEGKSTTSINIAYTMAETGKKVLLIEADMRLPVMAKRLKIRQAPGLSNLLAGQSSGNEVLQNSGLLPNLKIITAGAIPPNPAELLDSSQMEITLQVMREHFDVVIVDLPPVTAVSDALIVSKFLDGVILVCRQNYCDRKSLDAAVTQLRFSKGKILGFVVSDSDQQNKHYGKNYGYTHPSRKEKAKRD